MEKLSSTKPVPGAKKKKKQLLGTAALNHGFLSTQSVGRQDFRN